MSRSMLRYAVTFLAVADTFGLSVAADTSASSTASGLGDYILSGLGIAANSSAAVSSSYASITATSSHAYFSNSTHGVTSNAVPTSGNTTGFSAGGSVVNGSESGANSSGPITTTESSPWTVPASGNGPSYYAACNSELLSYSQMITAPNYTYFSNSPSWVTNYTAKTTTLCDGWPRIVGNITSTARYTTIGSYFTSTYDGPAPTCTIDASACESMQSAYASGQNAYNHASNISTVTVPTNAQAPPQCVLTGSAATRDYCGACTIVGGSVQLLYYPVTTSQFRDMCATKPRGAVTCPYGKTLPGINTNAIGQATAACQYAPVNSTSTKDSGPYTVSEGTTLYENLAYFSYATAYATNTCGRVGGAYAGGILGVASSDVYSMSGFDYWLYDYAYPFNFADLNAEVPASAYFAMYKCAEGDHMGAIEVPNALNGELVYDLCQYPGNVIWDELYQPNIAVPPQFRALDPAWSQCLLGLSGLWDPPKALQPVNTAAGPTTPSVSDDAPTTTAAPVPTPYSPASTTQAPETTPPPAESDSNGSPTPLSQSDVGGSTPTSSPDTSSGQASDQGQSNSPSLPHQSSGGDDPATGGSGIGAASPTTDSANPDPEDGVGSGSTASSADPSDGSPGVVQSTPADPAGSNIGALHPSTTTPLAGGATPSSYVPVSDPANVGGVGDATSSNARPASASPAGESVSADPASDIVAALHPSGAAPPDPSVSDASVSSADGEAGTTGGADSSDSDPGPGLGSNNGQTNVVSAGSAVYTVIQTQSAGGAGAVIVHGSSTVTLAAGAAQTTVFGGQPIEVLSTGGVVLGTGSSATTVDPVSRGDSDVPAIVTGLSNVGKSTVVSVGSEFYTVIQTQSAGSAATIIANGDSTVTLTAGAAPTTELNGQQIEAISNGAILLGTGSSAVSIDRVSESDPGATSSGAGDGVVGVTTVVTQGSLAYTFIRTESAGSAAILVAEGGSTITWTGGAAITTMIGDQTINVPGTGDVLFGTESSTAMAGAGSSSAASATTASSLQASSPSASTSTNGVGSSKRVKPLSLLLLGLMLAVIAR